MVAGVLLLTIGATKAPLLEIVPTLADQVTAVLAVPLVWAVNCCCPCEAMVTLLGEMESPAPGPMARTAILAGLAPYSFPKEVRT